MVQLKVNCDATCQRRPLRMRCFNSKMVQLKGLLSVACPLKRFEFQFQNGTITSAASKCRHQFLNLFQFQNGTIKSGRYGLLTNKRLCFNSKMVQLKGIAETGADLSSTKRKFQFQNGTIKRRLHEEVQCIAKVCFNSKMVQLKGQIKPAA